MHISAEIKKETAKRNILKCIQVVFLGYPIFSMPQIPIVPSFFLKT